MSRRKRKPPSKPSNGYLISFGDTMTAMLAFFIVLNTLAEEQTGANLHAGSGSFVTAISSMGLPGMFSGSAGKRVQTMPHAAPKYMVNEGESDEDLGKGPDDEDNGLRVLDREAENLQRMIVELEQQFDVGGVTLESRSVAFDLFEPLGKKSGKRLPSSAKRVLAQVAGQLRRPGYRLEIKLWSPTPSVTAMARTTRAAAEVADEVRGFLKGYDEQLESMRATASLWSWSDEKRPVMTILVARDTNIAAE